MTRLFNAFTERSLVVQLGVLVFACQLLAHVFTIGLTILRSSGPDPAHFASIPALKAGTIIEVLANATPAERDLVLALVARSQNGIAIASASAGDVDTRAFSDATRALKRLFPGVADQIGIASGIAGPVLPVFNVPDVYFRLDGSRALVASARVEPGRVPLGDVFLRLTLFLVVVPIALGTIWALMTVTAPLRRFAASADRFADDLDSTPLPVRGSAEMRSLAQAFNTMRGRIRDLIDGRSRMLAAVSHDLRTPLTRVRLRAEAQPAGEDREKTLKDVAAMDKMIGQALAYLRDGASAPRLEKVDLSSLVASLRDDFADAGGDVTLVAPAGPVVAQVEPDMISRAIGNLLDNALKFGTRARLSLEATGTAIVLTVADNGPGVAEADRVRVFEPFARGDAARSEPTGFGMGLAIARQIVERHGGTLALSDGEEGGLAARITLPAVAAAQDRAPARAARHAA
jgi:signal transduction histidine kinase